MTTQNNFASTQYPQQPHKNAGLLLPALLTAVVLASLMTVGCATIEKIRTAWADRPASTNEQSQADQTNEINTTNEQPTVAPVVPLTDDPACELSIREAGKEVRNEGQVTYTGRVVIAKVKDGWAPRCVQYDITGVADGERTPWKDSGNTGDYTVQLPTGVAIGKIVVWYER